MKSVVAYSTTIVIKDPFWPINAFFLAILAECKSFKGEPFYAIEMAGNGKRMADD